jgi:5-(carboxyamino)imidazole ribonucleotide mutase
VVGVPIKGGAVDGLDSLLSIAQMPPGVPVACVGLSNATNAAVLAVQILAVGDPSLRTKLEEFKESFEQAAANGLAESQAAGS